MIDAFLVRVMGRIVILIVTVIMMVTAEAFAQSSERDLTVSELQKQLAEMRSQVSRGGQVALRCELSVISFLLFNLQEWIRGDRRQFLSSYLPRPV